MVQIGDRLPDFALQNQYGESVQTSEWKGKKLIIFFYPKASTPTCTTEACNLRDHYAELTAKGYTMVGISTDAVAQQEKFSSKNQLPFPLLADTAHAVAELFGVWQEKKNYGKTYMGIVRKTFIFNEEGICTRVIDKVKSAQAAAQILEEVEPL